jgi:hypothetical protein
VVLVLLVHLFLLAFLGLLVVVEMLLRGLVLDSSGVASFLTAGGVILEFSGSFLTGL